MFAHCQEEASPRKAKKVKKKEKEQKTWVVPGVAVLPPPRLLCSKNLGHAQGDPNISLTAHLQDGPSRLRLNFPNQY
jgi:hypothetical protein